MGHLIDTSKAFDSGHIPKPHIRPRDKIEAIHTNSCESGLSDTIPFSAEFGPTAIPCSLSSPQTSVYCDLTLNSTKG